MQPAMEGWQRLAAEFDRVLIEGAGKPMLGVLPWLYGLMLAADDVMVTDYEIHMGITRVAALDRPARLFADTAEAALDWKTLDPLLTRADEAATPS